MNSNGVGQTAEVIRREIAALQEAKADIDNRISALQAQLSTCFSKDGTNGTSCCASPEPPSGGQLSADMIHRYSRQLILPSFGVEAQANLLKSSVLVIGAGGLGSPALLYLAACGVGVCRLGIVDHDVVELNNLHRQIIHTEAFIGRSKVESAAASCRAINSTVQIVEHKEAFRTSNALEIMREYDIVVDATDNVPSRYMINDCCAVLGKFLSVTIVRILEPLISGAALGLEGQLTVYNYNGGPCYRCLFPTPPPSTACQRCADSGVLGVVPGVIGCLQALEAIKVAGVVGEPLSGRMLLFDALSARLRVVRLSLVLAIQYFTWLHLTHESRVLNVLQSPLKLHLLPAEARITSNEYNERNLKGEPHILVDVRPAHHYKITSLPKSLNIPLASLEGRLSEIATAFAREESNTTATGEVSRVPSLFVICRRGNDSQTAVELLHKKGFPFAKDIIGGLESWSQEVDPKFPIY
ncbi:hypothetical protein SASPL_138159 [Salvia splendens]|uniref:Adenylyltransferase and sulfurtransferase MOCS3 n=1 Tax=Salvia splendens TaxID=180675 RepID=A0A8X8ZDM3_SALSN|nr:hypothetical protein SASPL_138159 [Salvia splendens]